MRKRRIAILAAFAVSIGYATFVLAAPTAGEIRSRVLEPTRALEKNGRIERTH